MLKDEMLNLCVNPHGGYAIWESTFPNAGNPGEDCELLLDSV